MNRRIFIAATAFLALVTTSRAHAFGSACRNVNFSVNNNFSTPITVERFELFSASEGRWLNENFPDRVVPANAQDFIVRLNEDVEHGESDRVTAIRVHYRRVVDNDPDGPGEWVSATWTDDEVSDPICVANRWFNATVG